MTVVTIPLLAAAGHIKGPYIDWAGLSPFIVLAGGALVVLLVGLLRNPIARERIVPALTGVTLAGAIATEIWRFSHQTTIIHGALAIDDLGLIVDMICAVAALATVLLSYRAVAPREAGHGEYHSLLLFSVMGMAVLSSSQDLITLFLGLELLSIPLYILCASEHRREGSLESGLKYLVIGSVGSATLVYGLAMIYGATGQTGLAQIGQALANSTESGGLFSDPLLLTGLALVTVGFAFKASVAPFHQWTPDVYEGAPTPITAFMATATKASALAIFLRFFDVAAISAQEKWAPLVATLAAITIIVGNVGALGQTSLKRMLGYSGVAQAGYMLSGVVVGTRLGVSATVLYLIAYLLLNIAAFASICAVERETGDDQIGGFAGLGARSPWIAGPLTIGMLGLAGIPGTVGFIGKFQLIHALVGGDYTWLALVLVLGSMVSLGYYLRVVATMWMPPAAEGAARVQLAPIAGGAPSDDEEAAGFPPAGPSDGADAGGGAAAGGAGGGAAAGGAGAGAAAGGAGAGAGGAGAGGAGAGGAGGGDVAADSHRRTADQTIPYPEVAFVAILFAAAAVVFGIVPSPLFSLASHAGAALGGLF